MFVGRTNKTENDWNQNQPKPESVDTIIKTHQHTKKQIIDIIMKQVGETPSKIPKKHIPRKCL